MSAIKNMIGSDGPTPSSTMAIAMTCFAAFGGFLFGYDTGYISGVKEMPVFLSLVSCSAYIIRYLVNFVLSVLLQTQYGEINPDPAARALTPYVLASGINSLITSILSAGTFVGALLAYPIGDYLGRRFGICAFLVLFCIGVALQTAATTVAPFTVGRVFAGLGVGGASCLVPVYQSECAPKAIRGGIVAAYQWMITIGLLVASIVVQQTKNINSEACYRIPIGLQFIWAFILGGGLLILPESPRWLLMKGREEEAQKALARVLASNVDSPAVNEEYAEIAANLHHERSLGTASYLECFRNNSGPNGLRTWTGISLQALQQLTGINFIFYYGTSFFTNAGIENPFTISIVTNVINVLMTVPGMLLVDRAGRRPLLLVGAAGMLASQLIVAIVGATISSDNLAGQRVLIAFVCFFISFFAATWGPLAWVVTGEIYPTAIRGRCMSMSTASNWLLNFAIGYSTPYLVDDLPGSAGLGSNVFFIWGGCCVLCFIFTWFFIPETKGLSLEQVDILYRNSSPRKSNAFRKRIMEENIHDENKQAYESAKPIGSSDHKEASAAPV